MACQVITSWRAANLAQQSILKASKIYSKPRQEAYACCSLACSPHAIPSCCLRPYTPAEALAPYFRRLKRLVRANRMQNTSQASPSRVLPMLAYNLRKRKAAADPSPSGPSKGPFTTQSVQPRGLAAAAAAAMPPAELASAAAEAAVAAAAAGGAPALVVAPEPNPTQLALQQPSPIPTNTWNDVGLKVDTSRYLPGVPSSALPLADAALASGSAATRALAARGFTKEMLQAAVGHLGRADAKLLPYIQQYGPPERLLAKNAPCFASLAKMIVFQQLATGAAAAIYGRVLQTCQCEEALTPEVLTAAPVADLRGCGLSERKVSYLLDLSRHWTEGHLSDEKIAALDDASLQAELTKVKGIGAWTVDMFSMFHLGHPDILPVGDLGVRRGMQVLYNLKELPDAAQMERIADAWRPFRSVGCYYMWRVEVPRTMQKKAKKNSAAPAKKTNNNSNRAPM